MGRGCRHVHSPADQPSGNLARLAHGDDHEPVCGGGRAGSPLPWPTSMRGRLLVRSGDDGALMGGICVGMHETHGNRLVTAFGNFGSKRFCFCWIKRLQYLAGSIHALRQGQPVDSNLNQRSPSTNKRHPPPMVIFYPMIREPPSTTWQFNPPKRNTFMAQSWPR